MNLFLLYDAGAVERFHTARVARRQSVGEHSWGVAMVLMAICNPSANLLRAAMLHDVPELATGDVPAPAKWACPPLNDSLKVLEDALIKEWGIKVELTELEESLLKWADMFELCMYAKVELAMGNQIMTGPLVAGIKYLQAWKPPTLESEKLLREFLSKIRAENNYV